MSEEYLYYWLEVDPEYIRAVDLVQEYRDEVDWAGGFTRGVPWSVYDMAKDIYIAGIESGVRVDPKRVIEVVEHLN